MERVAEAVCSAGSPPSTEADERLVVCHDLPGFDAGIDLEVVSPAALATMGAESPRRTRWLLLFESPASWLLRALPTPALKDCESGLARWVSAGSSLIRHLRRHRESSALVLVDDWRDRAESLDLAGLVLQSSRLTKPMAPVLRRVVALPSTTDGAGAIAAMLARRAASEHTPAMALFAELLAASEPSPAGTTGSPDGPEPSSSTLFDDFLRHRNRLLEVQARLLEREGQLGQEQAKAQDAQRRLQLDVSRLDAELVAARSGLAAARTEADQLLDRLLKTQESLESTHREAARVKLAQVRASEVAAQQLRAAREEGDGAKADARHARTEAQEARADAERARADAAQARAQTAALLAESHAAKAGSEELQASSRQQQLLAQALEKAQVAVNGLRTEVRNREHEATRLGVELANARGALAAALAQASAEQSLRRKADEAIAGLNAELQRLGTAQRQLERAATEARQRLAVFDDTTPGRLVSLDDDSAAAGLGQMVLGGTFGTSAHRHLELELLGARMPRGIVERQQIRLLDHRGRAGLALFSGPGSTRPLANWTVHGRESDKEFCLLIPGDRTTAPALQHLSATEWRFVLTLVVQLDIALADSARQDLQPWQRVARQLRMALWQSPPRLRYDRLEVFGEKAGEQRARVRIEFRGAVFGWLELGTLVLHWQPGAGYDADPLRTAVALGRDPSAGNRAPWLSTWPRTSGGEWAAAMSLPVGDGMSPGLRRQLWDSLSVPDRQLVLALLDAMPAAGSVAGTTVPPQTATVGQVAGRLHKQARRTQMQLELRRVIRGLMRR